MSIVLGDGKTYIKKRNLPLIANYSIVNTEIDKQTDISLLNTLSISP